MNKNKIILAVLCVAVTAAVAYQQTRSPEQVQQSTADKVHLGDNQPAPVKGVERVQQERGAAESRQSTASTAASTHRNVNPEAKRENKVSALSQSHDKPADHNSARQPKAHGHEHAQQRRHPEDNSIIPPGEPKKPLPENQGNS